MDTLRQLTATIAAALDKVGYHYSYREDIPCFLMEFKLKKSKLSEAKTIIQIKPDCFIVYAQCPIKVPQDKMTDVAVFLSDCNYNLIYGNFELDTRDGEIRCKNSFCCRDGMPSASLIEEMVNLPVMMLDRFGDELLDVLFGAKEPDKAEKEEESE